MYKITYGKDVMPEDILEKALKTYKEKEASKQLRDPYLRSLHKEANFIFNKVMEAMMEEIFDVFYEDNIEKSSNKSKAGLAKVEVIVNSKNGQYKSTRWKRIENTKNIRVKKIEVKGNIDSGKIRVTRNKKNTEKVDITPEKMYSIIFSREKKEKVPKVTRKDYRIIKKLIDSGQVEIELFYSQYQRFNR